MRSLWLKLMLVGVAFGVASCASNPNKARDIETKMDKSANISGDTNLGIKDGNLVVQKKVMMNEELRRLQNEVYQTEDKVYGNRNYGSLGLYGALRECKKKVSSKDMGGDGKLTWTEPIDRVTDKEDEWDVGIDEQKKIVGVSEEFLKDRIKRFKEYKRVLDKREDEYTEKLEICDAEVASRKHDMDKTKTQAQ
jgi:hypothetical protein